MAALGLISRCVAIRSAQHRCGAPRAHVVPPRIGSRDRGHPGRQRQPKGAPPAPPTLRGVPPFQSNGWGQGQIQGLGLKGAGAGSARDGHGLSDVLLRPGNMALVGRELPVGKRKELDKARNERDELGQSSDQYARGTYQVVGSRQSGRHCGRKCVGILLKRKKQTWWTVHMGKCPQLVACRAVNGEGSDVSLMSQTKE